LLVIYKGVLKMDFKILISTFVRQALTGVGAVLVAKGILPADVASGLLDQTTSLIVGGVLAVGAYVWSLVSKKLALETPVK